MAQQNVLKVCLFISIIITLTASKNISKKIKNVFDNLKFPESYYNNDFDEQYRNWIQGNTNNVEEFSGLIDGDMMLNKAVYPTVTIWPFSEVIYMYDPEKFTANQQSAIDAAMVQIIKNTNVRFRTYLQGVKFVVITNKFKGCWSHVGMQDNGQVINLQTPECLSVGTILHMLLHTLGFYHEHNVIERNAWITIYTKNVLYEKRIYFASTHTPNYTVQYDYESIMHGGLYLHSSNTTKKTIEPKIMDNSKIGQRHALSLRDIEKINTLYKSVKAEMTTTSAPKTTKIKISKTTTTNSKTLNMLYLVWPLDENKNC